MLKMIYQVLSSVFFHMLIILTYLFYLASMFRLSIQDQFLRLWNAEVFIAWRAMVFHYLGFGVCRHIFGDFRENR